MLVHLASGRTVAINFRETAPAALKARMFLDKNGRVDTQKALHSYLSLGVPGTVMGLNMALKKYGTMTLLKVMAPAIHLAKTGFVLSPFGARLIQRHVKYFRTQQNTDSVYLKHGQGLHAGDRLVQKNLATTLADIAKHGSNVFYHGWIAHALVKASQKHQGVLTLKDMARYHVLFSTPMQCQYRGYRVVTFPPPSSGVTVCEILNIVSGYDLHQMGFHSAATVHVNAEAMRYAFADRNQFLGDPRFVNNPIARLLSAQYAASIRQKIMPNQAGDSRQIGFIKNQTGEKMQTTNYSVVDKKGNWVDVTYTLNGFFGNKKIAGKTGFFLNNEMDDFALDTQHPNLFGLVQGKANAIAPNKRPLSSMSPTLLLQDGKPFLLLGAAGGSTIITTIVQTIENVVDFKMQLNAAVNQPRYHMQWLPDKIFMEPFAFSQDTQNALKAMDYRLQTGSVFKTQRWGQATAIVFDQKREAFLGANDNRRPNGLAKGA